MCIIWWNNKSILFYYDLLIMKLEIKQGHLKNQLLLPGLMIYMTLATQKVIQNKIKNHNEYDLHLIAKYVSTS